MFPALNSVLWTDPVRPLTTAGEELNDLWCREIDHICLRMGWNVLCLLYAIICEKSIPDCIRSARLGSATTRSEEASPFSFFMLSCFLSFDPFFFASFFASFFFYYSSFLRSIVPPSFVVFSRFFFRKSFIDRFFQNKRVQI